MNTLTPLLTPGIILVATLASGFWLSRAGRPYSTAIFTVHKLIALGAVVVTGYQLFGLVRGAPLPALVVALLVTAGISVAALFATGALMSQDNPSHALWLTVHRIAPALAVIAVALGVWLLTGRPR